MGNPAAGDLFPGSLPASLLGAAWTWLLAGLVGAALLPAERDEPFAARPLGTVLPWLVLGIAVQSQIWLVLGFFEALRPPVIVGSAAILTAAAGALAVPRVLRSFRAGRAHLPLSRDDATWLFRTSWLVVTFFVGTVAWFALWPSVFYDDLVYHLGLPRQALLTGTWPAMPGMHYSFMPAGWDAAYLLPLSLGGGSGPQLMNLVALVLFTVAVYRLARLGAGRGAAAATTALLVVAPMTGSLGAFAGNDLYVGLALCVAVERVVATGGSRPVRAGLLTGAAWAAKYSALPAAAGIALGAGILRRGTLPRRMATAGALGVTTLVVAAVWLARGLVLTGNPVYPAFYGLLGGRFWSPESAATVASEVAHGGFGDRGPAAFALAAVDLLARSDTLGYPSGVNAAFVAAGLVGLLLWRRVRGGPALLVVAAVTYVGWCLTSLNLRYALVLLAVLAPFAAAACQRALDATGLARAAWVPRLAAPALVCLLVAGPFLTAVHRHLAYYGPETRLFGGTSRRDIHVSRLNLAAAGRAMAERLPPGARVLLVGEGRVGLLPRPALASSAYDRPDVARLVAASSRDDPAALNAALAGFTHVVVNFRELRRFTERYGFADRFPPGGFALFRRWLGEGLRPVARFGDVVVYRIPREESAS